MSELVKRWIIWVSAVVFGATSALTVAPNGSEAATTAAGVSMRGVAAGSWNLVFNDEFSGRSLVPAKWRTRVQPRTGRRLCAAPSPSMVYLSHGKAVLGIKRIGRRTKSCPYGVFANAMIGTGELTRPGFATSYGRFAARIKFQRGGGQHGAIWLQGGASSSAEIDIAEYFGDRRPDGGIANFVHKTSASGALTSVGGVHRRVRRILGRRHTPSNGYHVWSVDWSPTGYVFQVDGHVIMRTSRNRTADQEFMVLSLLTSDWELPALRTTKTKMRVDWVRVWKWTSS